MATTDGPGGLLALRMVARLRYDWEASVGTEFDDDRAAVSSAAWAGAADRGDVAPRLLWGSVQLPRAARFLGWGGARLTLQHDPARGTGRIGLYTDRRWSLSEDITVSLRDSVSLDYDDPAGASAQWRTEKAVSIDSLAVDGGIEAGAWWAMGDPATHLSLCAEGTIGSFDLAIALDDVLSDDPKERIQVDQVVFGGVVMTLAVDELASESPGYRIGAQFAQRW